MLITVRGTRVAVGMYWNLPYISLSCLKYRHLNLAVHSSVPDIGYAASEPH